MSKKLRNKKLEKPVGRGNQPKPVFLVLADCVNDFMREKKIYNIIKKRRRDLYPYKNIGVFRSKFCNPDGSVFSVISKYFQSVDFPNFRFLANCLSRFKPSEFASFASKMNLVAKNHLSKFYHPSDWIKLVDLGVLVGYPKTEDRVFKDDSVRSWLCDPMPDIALDVGRLKDLIHKCLGGVTRNESGFQNFKDFLLARYTWMNDGACKYSVLKKNGSKVRTKKGAALSLSDRELLRAVSFHTIKNEGLRTFVKTDEKGLKGRFVVNAAFGHYVRSKFFIDYIIDNTHSKHPSLTLYSKEDINFKIMRSLKKYFHIPLDFEAFDHWIHSAFFEAFHLWCSEHLTGDFKEQEAFCHSLFGVMNVYDEKGVRVGVWKKGVPSGLYATAFLDSLFNLVAQLYIEDESGGKYRSLAAQGDDGDLECSVPPSLDEIAVIVEKIGMKVNVQKNWHTVGMTEFLKQVITEDNVFQYPSRSFASLAWAFPASFQNTVPVDKLVNLASLWKEFADRSGWWDEDVVVDDLFAGVKHTLRWGKQKIRAWLHTPSAVGGFALYPLALNYRFSWKPKILKNVFSGLRFKRFPHIQVDIVSSVFSTVFSKFKINTEYVPIPSLKMIAKKEAPTWDDYIEYTRATFDLKNKFGVTFPRTHQMSDILIRRIGYSDLFIKRLFGTFQYRGWSDTYFERINFANKYMDGRLLMKAPQLWK